MISNRYKNDHLYFKSITVIQDHCYLTFVLQEFRNERPRMEMPKNKRKLAAQRFFDTDLLLIKTRAGKMKRTTDPLKDPVKLRTTSTENISHDIKIIMQAVR